MPMPKTRLVWLDTAIAGNMVRARQHDPSASAYGGRLHGPPIAEVLTINDYLGPRHWTLNPGAAAGGWQWHTVLHMRPSNKRHAYCAYTVYARDTNELDLVYGDWGTEYLLWHEVILTGCRFADLLPLLLERPRRSAVARLVRHDTANVAIPASEAAAVLPPGISAILSPNTEEYPMTTEETASTMSNATAEAGPDIWNQAIMKCILENDERDLHALTGDREPGTRDIVVDVCDWDQKTILGTVLISIEEGTKKWKAGTPSTPYAWVVLTMMYRYGANEVLSEEEWVRRCKLAEEYLEEHGWVPSAPPVESTAWREGLEDEKSVPTITAAARPDALGGAED